MHIVTCKKSEFIMIKFLLLTAYILTTIDLNAQTALEEISKDRRCAASNYRAYPEPKKAQTSAPDGWKPFYISHYGRHGSRYHNKIETYEKPYTIMAKADSAGALTPLGHDVLNRLDAIQKDAQDRWGDLTELGSRQHQQIMTRMINRFPEVFTDSVNVDARSTMLARCILSMENAMLTLCKMRPAARIHHHATHRDMVFLNHQDKELFRQKMGGKAKECYKNFTKKYEDNNRLMLTLFSDTAYLHQQVDAGMLNYYLFKVANNLQSTHLEDDITLYDIFTTEELYRNWKKENAWWYINFGGSTLNGGEQPFTQRHLLRRMIEEADSLMQQAHPGVSLRYGHETVVMPLACLMDINGYGLATDDLESLDEKGWRNYKLFSMGSNIQLVFYRRHVGDDDVILKVLLNEEEATLPLQTDIAPYYHWRDFRDYYLKKLDDYDRSKSASRTTL